MSIDEAALRIEAPTAQDVETWGRNLQQDLREELKLSGSVGISPFRAVAKIASDRAKPGGLVVVAADRTQEFLSPLSVRVIPGVGPKTQEVLKRIGVETIGDIAKQSAEKLRRTLGTFADELRALARGEPSESDDFVDRGPRSRSVDRTFGEDVSDLEELLAATEHLSSELSEALQTERLRYQTVTIAARWADFTRSQKSQSLTAAHEGRETLWEVGRRLLREILRDEAGRGRRGVRTLSVRVERLVPALAQYPTLESFDTASSGRIKRALE
jgi:nucleotidyltransferase/DNA polymerase involved in DNA repair